MQIEEKLQDNDGNSENTPWEIKLKRKGSEKTQEEDDCDDYPCNQQRWKRQRQVDEEENDAEHHIPDTLERQLEKFMEAR